MRSINLGLVLLVAFAGLMACGQPAPVSETSEGSMATLVGGAAGATKLCYAPHGDVDGDGYTTLNDFYCVKHYSAWSGMELPGSTAPICASAITQVDLDCNEVVDAFDVAIARRYFNGYGLPGWLDAGGDGCVDACEAAYGDCDPTDKDCDGVCGGAATVDDCGVCDADGANDCVWGCMDPTACNPTAGATDDDGSCDYGCYGCTGPSSCNYDPDATIDDGSCVYYLEGSCDCTGSVLDCADVCGGVATVDDCGVCDGPGLNAEGCCGGQSQDCKGVCGGSATLDPCGVCAGPGLNDAGCCGDDEMDCADVCGGKAALDVCGVCVGGSTGNPAGALDDCGVCDADPSNDCVVGCTGPSSCNYNPEATVDDGSCVYFLEGACDCEGNVLDCAGVCGGEAVVDACGVCGGAGVPEGACDCAGQTLDCADVCGGEASLDDCGHCVGGSTGLPQGYEDACGVCDADPSNDCDTGCLSDAACDDGVTCTADVCDLETGTCSNPPAGPSSCCGEVACEDATCKALVCEGDASGACCGDLWDGFCAVIAEYLCDISCDAVSCDDGDACTLDDTCVTDQCVGQPTDCEDYNGCTANDCDPATGGCLNSPHGESSCCGDEACADPVCKDLLCSVDEFCCDDLWDAQCAMAAQQACDIQCDVFICDDEDACTVDDRCVDDQCVAVPLVCESESECLTYTCWEGDCFQVDEVICEDDNDCTLDTCDPASGNCYFPPATLSNCCTPHAYGGCNDAGCEAAMCDWVPECCDLAWDAVCADWAASVCGIDCDPLPCDDGDVCTESGQCEDGACVSAAVTCDDGDPCSTDACVATAGGCVHGVNAPSSCCGSHDGTGCDHEGCADFICSQILPECCSLGWTQDCADVALLYTDACPISCDAIPCDDGDPCTEADQCGASGCHGAVTTCDDGDPCTDDYCAEGEGCASTPTDCDDGDACTEDACISWAEGCQELSAVVCDDDNDCTVDVCDPATGVCAYNPQGAGCCDAHEAAGCGDPSCESMVCTIAPDCCAAEGGWGDFCVEIAHAMCEDLCAVTACDDGNPCTENDACAADQCVGASVSCPEGEVCGDGGLCEAAPMTLYEKCLYECADGGYEGAALVDCDGGCYWFNHYFCVSGYDKDAAKAACDLMDGTEGADTDFEEGCHKGWAWHTFNGYQCGASDGGAGGYDPCAGLACGAPCTLCAPDADGCFETAVPKTCSAAGVCGADPSGCDG